MLDLKELERKLDAALELETTETLNDWLNSLRNRSMNEFLGKGEYEELAGFEETIFKFSSKIVVTKTNDNIFDCDEYSLAA